MNLQELIELSNKRCIRDELGENWLYEKTTHGFIIHYDDMLGGIKVSMDLDPFTTDYVSVSRIFNRKSKEIFHKELSEAKLINVKDLHIGLDKRLKDVFGF